MSIFSTPLRLANVLAHFTDAIAVISVGVQKPKLKYIHSSECLRYECPFVLQCESTKDKKQLLILTDILGGEKDSVHSFKREFASLEDLPS